MKQTLNILVYALFMMGFGLIIWTVIPDGQVEKVFTINQDLSLFSEKIECIEIQNLMGAKYTLIYPRSIPSGESGMVQVDIEKAENLESDINSDIVLDACGISLEVWIDGEGVVAEPGNKIIKPYLDLPYQFIKFEIFPKNDQDIKGTIWINAVFPGETGSVLERIPIFAVPFVIQIRSLFGMPVRSIKILSSFLIVLALVLVIFQKDPERKRK